MKPTRTKYGNPQVVIETLSALGAWPVASTQQINDAARANGYGYIGAAETFMKVKVGRGKWDVSAIELNPGSQTATVTSSKPKKAGKPVLSSATPVLKKGKKATEQAWPEGTKILKEDGEPDTIVLDESKTAEA